MYWPGPTRSRRRSSFPARPADASDCCGAARKRTSNRGSLSTYARDRGAARSRQSNGRALRPRHLPPPGNVRDLRRVSEPSGRRGIHSRAIDLAYAAPRGLHRQSQSSASGIHGVGALAIAVAEPRGVLAGQGSANRVDGIRAQRARVQPRRQHRPRRENGVHPARLRHPQPGLRRTGHRHRQRGQHRSHRRRCHRPAQLHVGVLVRHRPPRPSARRRQAARRRRHDQPAGHRAVHHDSRRRHRLPCRFGIHRSRALRAGETHAGSIPGFRVVRAAAKRLDPPR